MHIGIDVVTVDRMRRAIEKHGDRFLRRVFTDAEIAYCEGLKNRMGCFAARFAAKEALLKALGVGLTHGVRLKEIEVLRTPGHPPYYRVTGQVQKILGGRRVTLNLTHEEQGTAIAVCLVYD